MYPTEYFMASEFMDKRCPGCENKIEYGVTTSWDEEKETHICSGCGKEVN